MKILSSIILVLLVIGAFWLMKSSPVPAPEITLNYTDGTRKTLADYRGQPVLLNFWSVNCPICLKDMPHLSDIYQAMQERKVQVIGVSIPQDPPPAVLALLEKMQPAYPTALDVHGEISQGFGNITVTPTTFVIDRKGMIVQKTQGAIDPVRLKAILTTL